MTGKGVLGACLDPEKCEDLFSSGGPVQRRPHILAWNCASNGHLTDCSGREALQATLHGDIALDVFSDPSRQRLAGPSLPYLCKDALCLHSPSGRSAQPCPSRPLRGCFTSVSSQSASEVHRGWGPPAGPPHGADWPDLLKCAATCLQCATRLLCGLCLAEHPQGCATAVTC